MLGSDDTVFCQDSGHVRLQTLAGFVIVIVDIGTPILFAWLLTSAKGDYDAEGGGASQHHDICKQLSEELDESMELGC